MTYLFHDRMVTFKKSNSRFVELFVVVHGQTLFLYAPCCACRSSAPLRGALLSCVDKKVTKEATRGGTEVDPIENLRFRIPSPRIKTVLPGTSPGNTSSQLCFLSSNIRSNSDLSSCLRFAQTPCLSLWERCPQGGEGKWHHRHPLHFRDYECITKSFVGNGLVPFRCMHLRHPYAFRFVTQFYRFAQSKAYSLRRRCPKGGCGVR